jgi:hypothetical protein
MLPHTNTYDLTLKHVMANIFSYAHFLNNHIKP